MAAMAVVVAGKGGRGGGGGGWEEALALAGRRRGREGQGREGVEDRGRRAEVGRRHARGRRSAGRPLCSAALCMCSGGGCALPETGPGGRACTGQKPLTASHARAAAATRNIPRWGGASAAVHACMQCMYLAPPPVAYPAPRFFRDFFLVLFSRRQQTSAASVTTKQLVSPATARGLAGCRTELARQAVCAMT